MSPWIKNKLFDIDIKSSNVSCSGLKFGDTLDFSKHFIIVFFCMDKPDENEFKIVFLLFENPAFISKKRSFSFLTFEIAFFNILSFITQESTFGEGKKLPLETFRRENRFRAACRRIPEIIPT